MRDLPEERATSTAPSLLLSLLFLLPGRDLVGRRSRELRRLLRPSRCLPEVLSSGGHGGARGRTAMGVFDFVKNGVREMMVARPDNLKSLIVYKHPDQNIPM